MRIYVVSLFNKNIQQHASVGTTKNGFGWNYEKKIWIWDPNHWYEEWLYVVCNESGFKWITEHPNGFGSLFPVANIITLMQI